MKKVIVILFLACVLSCENSKQAIPIPKKAYKETSQTKRVDALKGDYYYGYSNMGATILVAEELAKVTEELKKIREVLESKKEKSE